MRKLAVLRVSTPAVKVPLPESGIGVAILASHSKSTALAGKVAGASPRRQGTLTGSQARRVSWWLCMHGHKALQGGRSVLTTGNAGLLYHVPMPSIVIDRRPNMRVTPARV